MTEQAIKLAIADYELIARMASDLVRKADESKTPAEKQYLLGKAAYELKQYELAYEHLRESERLSATPETAARLALCAWRQRQSEEASKWISLAVERDANGSVVAQCIGTKAAYKSIQAAIELEKGNIDNALSLADGVFAKSVGDPLAGLTRANALLARGDHQEAQRTLDAVAKTAPPYLLRQIEALKSVAKTLFETSGGGRPMLAEFSALTARYAI